MLLLQERSISLTAAPAATGSGLYGTATPYNYDATAGTNEFGLRTEGQIIFGAGSGRGEAARIDASRRLLVGTF